MRSVLFVFLIAAALLAGDDPKQSGITELCWENPNGSFSFSLELVNILAQREAKNGRYVIFHRDGKSTIIYYDAKTEVFRVVKNFVTAPPDSNQREVVIDPSTGKPVLVEWH